jgi:aldose 1-epimerase
LVFDKVFTFKSFDKEQGIVEFQYNCDGESEYFPFSYLLTVAIRLIKQGVEIKTTVLNTGNADMPMGDGWHPYVSTGTKIDNLCIKIPANQYFKTDNTLIPTLEKMTEKSFSSLSLLGDCEMDSCFLISTTEGRV